VKLPDRRLDRKLSFGCGAALGFFLSFAAGTAGAGYSASEALMTATLVAVIMGLLAVFFGDRFLELVVRWLG